MLNVINTKVGIHRSTCRVWIEGRRLSKAGIAPNQRYDVKPTRNSITLKIHDDGQYKISSRTKNGKVLPILDFKHQSLQELFEESQLVTVTCNTDRITIEQHYQERRIAERESSFLHALRLGVLKATSLFTGGAILDSAIHEGLLTNGFKTELALAIEKEPKYLESALANASGLFVDSTKVYNSDINSVDPVAVDCSSHIFVAGVPCTASSKHARAVKKTAHAESRCKSGAGCLFFRTLQFLERSSASVFLIENVSNYASTSSMEVIRAVAENLGYVLFETIESGGNFGAIENRERLVVIGISKGLAKSFCIDSLKQFYSANVTPVSSILDEIEDDSDRWKTYQYLADKEKRDIASGNNFKRNLYDGSEYSTVCCGAGYFKARSSEPQLMNKDGIRSRLFTAAEHARLKSINPKMVDGLSESIAHAVLGQSVIHNQFKAVGALLGVHFNQLLHTVAN